MITKEGIIKFCQTAIDWLFLAAAFLIPLAFAGFYELFSIFVLYKVVLLRVLVSLAAIFYLAKVFLEGKIVYRFGKYFFAAAAILASSWLASSFFSINYNFSFWGLYNRQQGFFTLIFYLLFFILLILNLRDFSQVKRLLSASLLSSFFVCVYGLMQYAGLDPLRWRETNRIFSTFGQPNFLGHFLILVIPLAVYAIIFRSKRFSTRLLLAILLFGQFACLVFTASRSAFLGLGAELFLIVFIILLARGRRKIAIGLLIFSLASLVLFSFFSAYSIKNITPNNSFSYRIITIFDFSQGSVKARLDNWQGGLAEFRQESALRKLFGHGPDSLSEVFARRYQPSWALDERINTWPDRAHLSFLDIVLSFGLIGLASYLVFFYYFFKETRLWLKAAPRDEKFWLAIAILIALGGYFINNLFSFSDTAHYFYFYLLLGILVFLISNLQSERELKLNFNRFSCLAIFVFAGIFCVVYIFYGNLRLVRADYYFMKSVKFGYGNCPDFLNNNKKAIALGGGNSLFYQGEYILNSLNCLNRLSDQGIRGSIKENMLWYLNSLPAENNFYFAKYKANAEAVLFYDFGMNEYYSLARKNFEKLSEKYPFLSFIYEDWANFEFRSGKYEEAAMVAKKGLETLPLKEIEQRPSVPHRSGIKEQEGRFYDFLGASYEKLKNDDLALEYYKKIIQINPYYFGVYKKIADIYQRKGDLDQALWYNKRGGMLDKNNYAWPLAAALLYKEKGEDDKAIAYFKEAVEKSPDQKKKELEKQLNDLLSKNKKAVIIKK